MLQTAPDFYVNASLVVKEKLILGGKNVNETIDKMQTQIERLNKKILELEDIIELLYYAQLEPPGQGGPGYEAAKTSFETNNNM